MIKISSIQKMKSETKNTSTSTNKYTMKIVKDNCDFNSILEKEMVKLKEK